MLIDNKNDFKFTIGQTVLILIEKKLRLSPFKSPIILPKYTEGTILELRSTLLDTGLERGHRVKINYNSKQYIIEVHPKYLKKKE